MMGHKMMKLKRGALVGVELRPPPFENSGRATSIRGYFVIDSATKVFSLGDITPRGERGS